MRFVCIIPKESGKKILEFNMLFITSTYDCLRFQWNQKSLFGAILKLHDLQLITLRNCFCVLNEDLRLHLSLTRVPVKTMSINSLGNWAKDCYFWKVHSQVWKIFWQLKTLKKWWKILFISLKNFSFSIYLIFCRDFLVMYKINLIRKIRLISNFINS